MAVHHNPYESIPNTVVINHSKKSDQTGNDSLEQPSQSYIEPVEESYDEIDFITHMHEGSFGLDRSRVSEAPNQENSFHFRRSENKN